MSANVLFLFLIHFAATCRSVELDMECMGGARDECISSLPDCIPSTFNMSAGVEILDYTQIIFTEAKFTCSGNITQVQTWYRIPDGDIEAPVMFQVWHPVNVGFYKLLAEVDIPPSVNNTPVTVGDVRLPFFAGSVIGVFIVFEKRGLHLINIDVGSVSDIISGYYVFGEKLCEFDVATQGKIFGSAYSPEIVVTYEISEDSYSNDFTVDNTSFNCRSFNVMRSNSNGTNRVLVAVGASLAATILLLAIVVIIVLMYVVHRRRREKTMHLFINRITENPNYDKTISSRMSSEISNTDTRGRTVTTVLKSLLTPLLTEIETKLAGCVIDRSDLRLLEQISDGAFGKVYKGTYKKQNDYVAIKLLKDISHSRTEEFIRECVTAKKFDHPNVLGLIGVSILHEGIIPLMVMPYMQNGDVKSYLQHMRGDKLEVTEFPEGLTYSLLAQMCLDIAKGMEYLSASHFVHRDLAARNCMLDENLMVKVSDFGLTRDVYVSDYYTLDHSALLPVKWMAPEAMLERKFSTKTDVWSFGITCWEVFTLGLQPYPSVSSAELTTYLKSGKRPDKPLLCSNKMYETMSYCWKYTSQHRPSFSELVEELNRELQDNNSQCKSCTA